MGFLDSLFGTGGSASQEQARTTAQTNYPDWYNRLQQANLLRGAEAAFETYQPYGGPRMALAGPAQQAARAGFGGLAGIAAPSFAEAMRQSRLGATQLAGADITPYMSPFQQAVTDVSLREARRQGDIQRRGLESQATKAGAFGGSRAALEQMEAERNIQQNLGDIQATGSQRAFESALAQLMGDRAAASQAAPQMAALGTGLQGVLTSGLKESELAGERERAERQGALDIAYQDYLTQRAYPMAQASGLQALLQGSQVPGSSLQTTFGQPPSVAGQIGGLGLSTLGLLGSTGAFGPAGYLASFAAPALSSSGTPKPIYAEGGEVGYQDGSPGGVGTEEDRDYVEVEGSSLLEKFGDVYGDIMHYGSALISPYRAGQVGAEIGAEIGEDVAEIGEDVVDYLTERERVYINRDRENAGPRSDPNVGMTPRLAAIMAGDENVTEPEPDLQEDLVSEESRGLDITYNDLLTAGLAMMSAASQPGASAVGSLGAGGLSALQAKKEEEARRLDEDLARRKLDLTDRELDILEGRYLDEYRADIAKIQADIQAGQLQAVLDRRSDLLSALGDIDQYLNPDLYKQVRSEYDNIELALSGYSAADLVKQE